MDTGLTFNDLIPNNMTMRRPGSRVSLDNEFVVKSMEGTLEAFNPQDKNKNNGIGG
jgi:hypothetical protein